ncbi:TIGR04338 family metallohydrolase [Williamsia sp. MIQD14]|uniref:TIGR04338 family metallohydrolase n=1 Tax=Williamsia sp. MIQD14 TaxID=3425703 RepID=UPI003DA12B06
MSPSRGRDTQRSALYAAEAMVLSLFESEQPTVELAGTAITLPPEARFGSVESVRTYVDRVLARPSVQERFPRAGLDVGVRARRGHTSAHYESAPTPVIAVPESTEGRWALRELVVLHEVSHHLTEPGVVPHGPEFVGTLVDLVADVLGPEAGFVYRVILTDSGIALR